VKLVSKQLRIVWQYYLELTATLLRLVVSAPKRWTATNAKMAREYIHTTNYFYSSPVAFLVFSVLTTHHLIFLWFWRPFDDPFFSSCAILGSAVLPVLIETFPKLSSYFDPDSRRTTLLPQPRWCFNKQLSWGHTNLSRGVAFINNYPLISHRIRKAEVVVAVVALSIT
jgi:hypothetical protein